MFKPKVLKKKLWTAALDAGEDDCGKLCNSIKF